MGCACHEISRKSPKANKHLDNDYKINNWEDNWKNLEIYGLNNLESEKKGDKVEQKSKNIKPKLSQKNSNKIKEKEKQIIENVEQNEIEKEQDKNIQNNNTSIKDSKDNKDNSNDININNIIIGSINYNIIDNKNKDNKENEENINNIKDNNNDIKDNNNDIKDNNNEMKDNINNSKDNDFICTKKPKEEEKEEENQQFQQSILKNSSKKESSRVFTNRGSVIEKKEDEINNTNNDKNKSDNNYEQFDLNKDFIFVCPKCKKNINKIESVLYQPESKEFLVTYKCLCKEPTQKYFYNIISKDTDDQCIIHREFFIKKCEDCNILLCETCINENKKLNKHKEHKIESIINKDIMDKIEEKKDEFKGIKILQKLYDLYNPKENNNIYLINQEDLINQEVINSLKNVNNIKSGTVVSKKNLEKINFKNIKTIQGHDEPISSMTKLKNEMIATGSYDGKVKIWDITKDVNDALIMEKNAVGTVFCLLEFEPDKLLGGTSSNMVNLWDLTDKNNKEYIHTFYKHYLWVHALVKCDDDHFASASNDTKIIIWNFRTQKSEKILEGHTDCIMDMIMLQNGHLCTASADETIRVWDWKEGKCLFSFKAHENYVKCLCELNDKKLITGSEDNNIGVWKEESDEYKKIQIFEGHNYPVRSLCQFDENRFISGSFDNKIKIWKLNLDKNEYEHEQTLEGHLSNVISVIKYSDDVIISCSNDKTIKIWKNIKI